MAYRRILSENHNFELLGGGPPARGGFMEYLDFLNRIYPTDGAVFNTQLINTQANTQRMGNDLTIESVRAAMEALKKCATNQYISCPVCGGIARVEKCKLICVKCNAIVENCNGD